jgi:hypothetical protein
LHLYSALFLSSENQKETCLSLYAKAIEYVFGEKKKKGKVYVASGHTTQDKINMFIAVLFLSSSVD